MSYPPRNVAGMNPSRRRRADSPEERCRCAECAALDEEPDLDPEACMTAVADDIQAVGWSVSAVLGDEIAPPWAYTVGLWLSHQGPELAIYGLPVEHMTVILNSIADRIASGRTIAAGDLIDGICPCSLAVRPVHASWRTRTGITATSGRPASRWSGPTAGTAIRAMRASSSGTRAGSRCCGCPLTTTLRACGPGSTSSADPSVSWENNLLRPGAVVSVKEPGR